MGNYHYIISGLPDMILEYENSGYSFDNLLNHIKFSLKNEEDLRSIEWLLFGIEESKLSNHFYREVAKSKIRFLREFFKYDLEIRNIQAAFIARKSNLDISKYLVGNNQVTEQLSTSKSQDFGLSLVSEDAPSIIAAINNPNILEREQQLDLLKWNKANEICLYNYFDINVILSFIYKASLVKRWSELDKKKGTEIFKKLIEEVRGSFNLENNN